MNIEMRYFWQKMTLAVRITLFILFISIGMVFLLAGARNTLAASLRDMVTVTGDSITLGDLFDGLTENADYVLGPSPQPGKDMVINARTLYRIALSMELPWRPANSMDQVVIRRAATIVEAGTIDEALRASLEGKGLSGSYGLKINGGSPQMILTHGKPATVEVMDVSFDSEHDTFQASLAAPSSGNPEKRLSVTGQIERMVKVPVLKNSLRHGDIIGMTDIDWIDVPEKDLQHDTILKAEDLTGMTPRRVLPASKTVNAFELESPKLVDRGDEVSLVFADGPLVLTVKGKALQPGAKGEIIRVTNLGSSKSVEGYVTAEREVTVR